MKLSIRSILAAGDTEKERVTFLVKGDTDLGDYLVTRNPVFGDRVGIDVANAFWFPTQMVKEKDLVVIYSRSGTPSTRDLSEGRTTYFYYWGLGESIWQENDYTPVLLHAPEWSFKDPATLKRP